MKQRINLGSTPADEPCAQVGAEGYAEKARAECKRYIQVLRHAYIATHGALPEGLNIRIASAPHDYGSYYEVVAEFDENDAQAYEAALWLDSHAPAEWPSQLTAMAG
jgi:hypothetical protein